MVQKFKEYNQSYFGGELPITLRQIIINKNRFSYE